MRRNPAAGALHAVTDFPGSNEYYLPLMKAKEDWKTSMLFAHQSEEPAQVLNIVRETVYVATQAFRFSMPPQVESTDRVVPGDKVIDQVQIPTAVFGQAVDDD